MGFVFVPLYISYLGIEAYGLIGLFASLQAWLALLDLGLSPTLNREMARLQGGAHTGDSIRDLLRSIEVIYAAVAIAIAVAFWIASEWLATNWLHAEKLPVEVVASALSITGLVIAFRWIGGLYRSALGGLQEQVWLNVSKVVFATLRGVGVIAVLAFISPSVEAFFLFQGVVAAAEALAMAAMLHRLLPKGTRPSRFSLDALTGVWRFAAGISLMTLVTLAVSQIDKIVLPTVVPLSTFGYYLLASTLAGSIGVVSGPVLTAVGPRFSELVARGATSELTFAYHRYSQLMALVLIPATGVIAVFSRELVAVWTNDAAIGEIVGPILSILTIGFALSGLTTVPIMLQWAHGGTWLSIVSNAIAGLIVIPLMLVVVPHFGAMGAALIISATYSVDFLILPYVIHRMMMPGATRDWYIVDILPVILSVCIVVVPFSFLPDLGRIGNMTVISLVAATSFFLSVASIPFGRDVARRLARRTMLARWL